MNFKMLEQYLDSLGEEYGLPGLDIIVTKDHETVFRHMVGHADKEGKKPVSDRDFYYFYSCSKVITMTAMLQLIEQGKASLYDPVCRFLPEWEYMTVINDDWKTKGMFFSPGLNEPAHFAKQQVRIIDLMSMTAGLTYDLQSNKPHSAVDQPSAYWDIERTRKAYLAAGVPYEKMVLGIPFYVRHSFDGPNSAVDWKDLNALAASDKAFKIDNWDSEAQTPYVTYNGQFWGGYDNPESIAKKGRRYVGGFGIKGMLYWDCGADDARYTLSKACWNAVMKSY